MTKFLKGFIRKLYGVVGQPLRSQVVSYFKSANSFPCIRFIGEVSNATLLFGGVMLWKKQTTGENLFYVEKEDRNNS